MNLTCETLRDLLYDHHAGELVVEVHASFEAHLVICENCLHYVESYRHTVKLVRKLPKCEMPEGLEAKLRAAMSEHLDGK